MPRLPDAGAERQYAGAEHPQDYHDWRHGDDAVIGRDVIDEPMCAPHECGDCTGEQIANRYASKARTEQLPVRAFTS
jgi:hypothetical protein